MIIAVLFITIDYIHNNNLYSNSSLRTRIVHGSNISVIRQPINSLEGVLQAADAPVHYLDPPSSPAL